MSIKELIGQKDELIRLKKAEVKCVKGGLSVVVPTSINKGVYQNGETELKRTIIGNTYNWLDSHGDVHLKGVFAKSIKERQNGIFHLHDHEFKLTAKVGEPQSIYEDSISWKELGIDKEGQTEALFMDSNIIKSYNERIFNDYKEDKINQHSVGMQYVKIDLAVNDEEYEEEYKNWTSTIDLLGNKSEAEEIGYYWIVREAKLIEISAVLLGSNSLTPTQSNKEAAQSTSRNEPSKDTQKRNYYLSHTKK